VKLLLFKERLKCELFALLKACYSRYAHFRVKHTCVVLGRNHLKLSRSKTIATYCCTYN